MGQHFGRSLYEQLGIKIHSAAAGKQIALSDLRPPVFAGIMQCLFVLLNGPFALLSRSESIVRRLLLLLFLLTTWDRP